MIIHMLDILMWNKKTLCMWFTVDFRIEYHKYKYMWEYSDNIMIV